MNILFLDQFSDMGGAQQCLLDLAPAIQARGWKMTVAVPGAGRLVEKLRERGVTVFALPTVPLSSGRKSWLDVLRFAWNLPWLAREIARLARESNADLLYVNGPRVLPAAAWVARRTGRPLVFHCHNHLAPRPEQVLAGRSLRFSNARMIACCRHVARPMWPFIDPGRLRVIYNSVAGPGADPPTPAPGPRIGVIGRISPEKGQAEFVQAAALVVQEIAGCTFVVCGAPLFSNRQAGVYCEHVRALARRLPVEFPGWQEDVSATLAGLDVMVVPSLREPGAPRVILEAYAARIPVVAFASGGIPEILTQGETGFLVEPPTPQALAAKLIELLHAPGELRRVADRAHETWKENFSLPRYQREVLEVIGLTQTRPAVDRSI